MHTNKQNITRDTETENRLTVTRGVGVGDNRGKGEGTIIKDNNKEGLETGEGGGEGWGEKAENFT